MQHDAIRSTKDSNDEISTILRCGGYLDQQIETVSACIRARFFRLSQREVRAMLFKEGCDAANVEVAKRGLFITRNSLKSHDERNLFSPVSNPCAITPKLCTYSRPRFFENPPAPKSKLRATLNFR